MSCLPKQQGGVPGSGPEGGQFTQCRACWPVFWVVASGVPMELAW